MISNCKNNANDDVKSNSKWTRDMGFLQYSTVFLPCIYWN